MLLLGTLTFSRLFFPLDDVLPIFRTSLTYLVHSHIIFVFHLREFYLSANGVTFCMKTSTYFSRMENLHLGFWLCGFFHRKKISIYYFKQI